jgi:hypothetical protein
MVRDRTYSEFTHRRHTANVHEIWIKPLRNSALDNSFIDQAAQDGARDLRSAFRRGEDITERISTEISKYKFYHEFEIIPGVRVVGERWAMLHQGAFRQSAAAVAVETSARAQIAIRHVPSAK